MMLLHVGQRPTNTQRKYQRLWRLITRSAVIDYTQVFISQSKYVPSKCWYTRYILQFHTLSQTVSNSSPHHGFWHYFRHHWAGVLYIFSVSLSFLALYYNYINIFQLKIGLNMLYTAQNWILLICMTWFND